MEGKRAKQLAAEIMKVGVSKVKIEDGERVDQAITRDDVRKLINEGSIARRKIPGASKGRARILSKKKVLGRKAGAGKRKGAKKARTKKKETWMKKVRAQRKLLKEHKEKLKKSDYRKTYKMVKGGYFRSKKQLSTYIEKREGK
jgi:large subunit ribosomal protein L19e